MPTSRAIRVLVLDAGRTRHIANAAVRLGLSLHITSETAADGQDPNSGYIASKKSLQLARSAVLETFDCVFIGNNMGTGEYKAAAIPQQMRPRTFIGFNHFELGMEESYRRGGFHYFGYREWDPNPTDEPYLTSLTDFLLDIARQPFA